MISPDGTTWPCIRRPLDQTEYMFIDEEWLQISTVTFQYDSKGNPVVQEADDDDGLQPKPEGYVEPAERPRRPRGERPEGERRPRREGDRGPRRDNRPRRPRD